MSIAVIGAGLAGCEAAWAIAESGEEVRLYEMKPAERSPAHRADGFAELVCSNSLKAMRIESAAGLLKEEMRRLGSLCLDAADTCTVPAGGALAVDREIFSAYITEKIKNHPNITVVSGRCNEIPAEGIAVVATGPLTDGRLAESIKELVSQQYLSFFDAAAPVLTAESIDTGRSFAAARYGRGGDDYINCPMDKEEYLLFHKELVNAETAPQKGFEGREVYEGCMPVEVLAKRGEDSIRFGPLKPVGLFDPATGRRPYAVVQLRKENAEGTLLSPVGFQTNLKFPEQKRVFSLIPALKNAEFVRYGVMHRNSFINSPQVLNRDLSAKADGRVFFAGQLSGVEGYMESAASGIIAGRNALARSRGEAPLILPEFTMIGALLNYITGTDSDNFQPMGANFGILPPLDARIKDKKERYLTLSKRALEWYNDTKAVNGDRM